MEAWRAITGKFDMLAECTHFCVSALSGAHWGLHNTHGTFAKHAVTASAPVQEPHPLSTLAVKQQYHSSKDGRLSDRGGCL